MGRGSLTPFCVLRADDCAFTLHVTADAQVQNTAEMLEVFALVCRQGKATIEQVSFLFRHTRLEHRWNIAQLEAARNLRRSMNELQVMVRELNAQNKAMKKAALGSGPGTKSNVIVSGGMKK